MATLNRKEIRETLKLGIPMAGAQLSQTLMGTTDVALVGRLKGDALAAMAVGQACYGFLFALGVGLMAAVSPLISQAHGAHNHKLIARTMTIGVCLAFLAALPCWALLYQVDVLFATLGYQGEMSRLAVSYTRVLMLGLPFAFLFVMLKNTLDSVSRPRWPLAIAVAGIFVNGVADYGFIFGLWGLPELGVVGTGVATSLVNLFMAVTLFFIARAPARFNRGYLKDKAAWSEILSIGLPIAGSIGVEVGLFVAGALLMGKLGVQEAAAHQIVMTLAATAFMVPLGVSFAGSTRVGQAVGRKDYAAVRPAGFAAILVGCGFMVITAILFLTFPETLIKLFWAPNSEKTQGTLTLALQLLAIAGFFQIADGLQVTAIGVLRGMKDVKIPLLIGGLSYWGVGLGSAIYLAFYTPLRHLGVWIGFLLGLATTGTVLLLRFSILSRRLIWDTELQKAVSVGQAATPH